MFVTKERLYAHPVYWILCDLTIDKCIYHCIGSVGYIRVSVYGICFDIKVNVQQLLVKILYDILSARIVAAFCPPGY